MAYISVFTIVLLPLILAAVTAPVGATICGAVAVSQIRQSGGRLYGLGLALADALLFPLLVLDGIIGWGLVILANLIHFSALPSDNRSIGILVAIPICAVVDFLIVRWAWQAAQKPAEQTSPAPRPPIPTAAIPNGRAGQDVEKARQAVKAPAIGLLLAAGISIAVLFAVTAMTLTMIREREIALDIQAQRDAVVQQVLPGAPSQGGAPAPRWQLHSLMPRELPLLAMAAGLLINGLIVWGAFRMMQLRNRGLCITAAILAMIASPGNIIGLPMGIWALVVLCRREVVEAFKANRAAASPTAAKRRRWVKPLVALAIAGVVALLVRQYVLGVFSSESDAVSPEVTPGSRVFVYKLVRTFHPGDIILYQQDSKNLLGRVVQDGPTDGLVLIERRGQGAQAVATAEVVGRVVFNTRTTVRVGPPATQRAAGQSSPPATQPAAAGNLGDRQPLAGLRYLAVQADRAGDEPSVYWRPDGQIISDEQEIKRVRGLQHNRMKLRPDESDWAFYYLWFAIPNCDERSHVRTEFLDADGKPINTASYMIGAGVQPPESPAAEGWMSVSLNPGKKGQIPPAAGVLLEYATGQWTTLGTITGDMNGTAKFGPLSITGNGTDPQGLAFVGYTHVAGETDGNQYLVEAVMKDGRSVDGLGSKNWKTGNAIEGRFLFNAPLQDVDHFTFRSRPTRTVIFQNVSLQPGVSTRPQVKEVTPRPATQSSTRPEVE